MFVTGGIVGHPALVRLRHCTFSRNTAPSGGAMDFGDQGFNDSDIANCVFWGDSPEEINVGDPDVPGITYSDVQGGWPGVGNIGEDPINHDPDFCDPDGSDGIPGTLDDNFRLDDGSPCIDAGDDGAVPVVDEGDVDDDGVTAEPLPWDADTAKPASHHGRVFDVVLGPVGTGVDMGAYENQHIRDCPWDIASQEAGPPPDGEVGVNDFLRLNGDWGPCPGCGADFDCNLAVDATDFLALSAHWGPCPGSSPSSFGGGSLGAALWLMGFADLAAYEAWLLEATDAEAQASLQILAELLVLFG
jgi:hypothetical protein